MASLITPGDRRWPATFSALSHPNYRRWFVGQSLSLMGTWMQSVAQGWVVYELTGSKVALGTISFIGTIPTLFLMLPAGALADRVSRRKMLLVTQSAMMCFAFVLALLTGTGHLQVWHIGVLAFGLGLAQSFDAPTRQALVVELVPDRRDFQNAIALNSMVFNMARIVGPAIGGLILATAGATWCFALNGVSFLAVLIAVGGMHIPDREDQPPPQRLMSQIGIGLRYVWDNAPIRTLIAIVGVISLIGMSYSVLMPVFAVDVLRVGEAGLGGLNALVGIGALVGALVVATLSRRTQKGLQLTFGSLILPIGLVVFGLSRSFPLSLAALALVGFGMVTLNATANTLVQNIVPDALRGRVMSVYMLMMYGTTPFGALLAGFLAEAIGPSSTVIVSGLACFAFAGAVALAVPAVRRLRS